MNRRLPMPMPVPARAQRTAPGRSLPVRILRAGLAQAGFTVIELMIGIVVLAILTTLALPSFRQFILNNRLASQANEMVASFQFARSEALKRSLQVQVCASSGGNSCDGGAWNEGWIAIADPGGTEQELLRVWPSPGDDFVFDPSGGTVSYEPNGFSSAAAEQQFDLSLDGCTIDSARSVRIERTGRVSSERVDCTTN